MNLSFELLQEKDIPSIRELIEGFMEYDHAIIRAFLSEIHNIALVAKLGQSPTTEVAGLRRELQP